MSTLLDLAIEDLAVESFVTTNTSKGKVLAAYDGDTTSPCKTPALSVKYPANTCGYTCCYASYCPTGG